MPTCILREYSYIEEQESSYCHRIKDDDTQETDINIFIIYLLIRNVIMNLFVVLLKSGKILASLRELSLFHSLSDIPGDFIG